MKVVDIERVVILMRFIQYGWDEEKRKRFDDNLRMMLETQCEDLEEHDKQIKANLIREVEKKVRAEVIEGIVKKITIYIDDMKRFYKESQDSSFLCAIAEAQKIRRIIRDMEQEQK